MNKKQQHIESFISRHRKAMDAATPPPQVWERLNAALAQRESDALERFIRERRADFDTYAPSSALWLRIAQALGESPARPVWRVSRRLAQAAAAVTLLLIGLAGGMQYQKMNRDTRTETSARAMAMSDLSPQYARLESDYIRQIAEKSAQLGQFAGYQAVEVQNDLLQMELIMAELQQELAQVPPGNREQVAQAMIETYEAKAAILTRVLERLAPLARDSAIHSPTSNSRL